MIKNKIIYENTPGRTLELHIIDDGAESTYCNVPRGSIGKTSRDRRYTGMVPDAKNEFCPICHKENKKRHFIEHLKPINTRARSY